MSSDAPTRWFPLREWQVTTSFACAWVGTLDDKIVDAAPIFRTWIGQNLAALEAWGPTEKVVKLPCPYVSCNGPRDCVGTERGCHHCQPGACPNCDGYVPEV